MGVGAKVKSKEVCNEADSEEDERGRAGGCVGLHTKGEDNKVLCILMDING